MSNTYDQRPPGYDLPYPPAPPLANWGRRVVSFLIDWLIVGLPGTAIQLATGSSLGSLVNLVTLLVVANMEGSTGQSPGKKVVGTRVLRIADGSYLGTGLAIGRRLLHLLDALCCLIGYLWPLWDAKRQTFADKMAGTVVVVTG
ncbi:RDD family protein [Kitasatospora sp. GAS1066B]|uniref:RDD family protein n=1 Tax=Kitasatospora sp. GAS1066B TaxID=3156271 RepID=UPI0035160285